MRLYLVKLTSPDGDEEFYKVGVTNKSVKERFTFGKEKTIDSNNFTLVEKLSKVLNGEEYISDTPYNHEELHAVSYKYEGDALLAEEALLETLKPSQYFPKLDFSGKTECFKIKDTGDIIKYMDADSKQRKTDEPDELQYKLTETFIVKNEIDRIKKHKLVLEAIKKKNE